MNVAQRSCQIHGEMVTHVNSLCSSVPLCDAEDTVGMHSVPACAIDTVFPWPSPASLPGLASSGWEGMEWSMKTVDGAGKINRILKISLKRTL